MVGRGVEKDVLQGLALYKVLAKAGAPVGLANLGISYYSGVGLSRSASKAMRLFHQAAEQRDALAKAYCTDCWPDYGTDFEWAMKLWGQTVNNEVMRSIVHGETDT
jgi:TPR repeat protein